MTAGDVPTNAERFANAAVRELDRHREVIGGFIVIGRCPLQIDCLTGQGHREKMQPVVLPYLRNKSSKIILIIISRTVDARYSESLYIMNFLYYGFFAVLGRLLIHIRV